MITVTATPMAMITTTIIVMKEMWLPMSWKGVVNTMLSIITPMQGVLPARQLPNERREYPVGWHWPWVPCRAQGLC